MARKHDCCDKNSNCVSYPDNTRRFNDTTDIKDSQAPDLPFIPEDECYSKDNIYCNTNTGEE